MAPLGRFIEIDRNDFLKSSPPLEMAPLQNTIPFVVTGLLMIVDERPAMIMLALQKVLKLAISEHLKISLPHRTISISEMESAPCTICHAGKVVTVSRPYDVVEVVSERDNRGVLSADASCVLVGGSGGLGEAQALWAAFAGANYLILASMSDDSSHEVYNLIAELHNH